MFAPTSNMSNVWRGITDNAKWISKGSAVAICNGKRTLFWDHCWATLKPLRDLAIAPIPDSIDGAIVEEMWTVGEGWNWDLFANFLPQNSLHQIAAHKVIENPEIEDSRYWKGSKSGAFSVKQAMKIMKNDEYILKDPKWDLAWSAQVQQRVRVFLWLILHDRVLCNANRVKRHLSDEPRCNRCNTDAEETLIHMLRDCPRAKELWLSVGGAAFYPSFYTGDLSSWMTSNLKAEGIIHSEKWPVVFALTLWWAWKWRNCEIFGRDSDIPLNKGNFIKGKADETWSVKMGDGIAALFNRPVMKQQVLIRGQAPPAGWFTLNTDGAAHGSPGLAGGGGVLRDCQGRVIKGFMANFGICTAYRAELMAIKIGLQMASNLGVSNIEVQMDNKACIEAIQNDQILGGEGVHMLRNCRNIIRSFGCNFRIFHCFREGNKVADRLANLGVFQADKCLYFEVPPIEIKELVREDMLGVTTPRFIA